MTSPTAGARQKLAASAVVIVLVMVGCSDGSPPNTGEDMGPRARAYLTTALDLMERDALLRDDVDWAEVRRDAFTRAGDADNPDQTHQAIAAAVASLGDGHSTFRPPAQSSTDGDETPTQVGGLSGRALPGGAGHLALPGVGGSDALAKAYVREGRAALAAAGGGGGCGWVIDLRTNTGGNMWPMLAVVAPLLGDGNVGAFVYPDGRERAWTIDGAAPRLDANPFPWGPGDPPPHGGPVAVLTGERTASAGEAVAVAFRGHRASRSFGTATAGVPTANETHRLSDGATIILTEARDADRDGVVYDSPIVPDEEVHREPGTSPDTVLDTATRWITTHPDCDRP